MREVHTYKPPTHPRAPTLMTDGRAYLVAVEDLLEEPDDGPLPRRKLRRAHVPEGQVPDPCGVWFVVHVMVVV